MSDMRENLRRAMAAKGLKAIPLAQKAGVGRTLVHDYLNGRSKTLRMDSAAKIAAALEVPLEVLTIGPDVTPLRPEPATTPQKADLPVFASAQGGDDGMIITMEPIEYIRRPDFLEHVRDAFAFYVVGESMEPRFEQGERLLVHPQRPARPGSDVLIVLTNGEGPEHFAMVKRLISVSRDVIRVRQHNPARDFDIDRKTISSMFRIMGTQHSD